MSTYEESATIIPTDTTEVITMTFEEAKKKIDAYFTRLEPRDQVIDRTFGIDTNDDVPEEIDGYIGDRLIGVVTAKLNAGIVPMLYDPVNHGAFYFDNISNEGTSRIIWFYAANGRVSTSFPTSDYYSAKEETGEEALDAD